MDYGAVILTLMPFLVMAGAIIGTRIGYQEADSGKPSYYGGARKQREPEEYAGFMLAGLVLGGVLGAFISTVWIVALPIGGIYGLFYWFAQRKVGKDKA